MWGQCRGLNLLSPYQATVESLDEVFACFGLSQGMFRPVSPGFYILPTICFLSQPQYEFNNEDDNGKRGNAHSWSWRTVTADPSHHAYGLSFVCENGTTIHFNQFVSCA